MMPGSSSRRALKRDDLLDRRVLDEHDRTVARLAPPAVDRLAHLRFVGPGRRGEQPERVVDVPDCSRTSARLNVFWFSTSTLPLRSNSTPRGAGSGSRRRWLFSAISSNFWCWAT